MTYTILFQKIDEKGFPSGYYYANIPALDITTHGEGIEGARDAAKDLLKIMDRRKKAAGESINPENEITKSRRDDILIDKGIEKCLNPAGVKFSK